MKWNNKNNIFKWINKGIDFNIKNKICKCKAQCKASNITQALINNNNLPQKSKLED